jgi:hypothetical protein
VLRLGCPRDLNSAADERVQDGWPMAYPDSLDGKRMTVDYGAGLFRPEGLEKLKSLKKVKSLEKVNACAEVSTAFVSRQTGYHRFPWNLT